MIAETIKHAVIYIFFFCYRSHPSIITHRNVFFLYIFFSAFSQTMVSNSCYYSCLRWQIAINKVRAMCRSREKDNRHTKQILVEHRKTKFTNCAQHIAMRQTKETRQRYKKIGEGLRCSQRDEKKNIQKKGRWQNISNGQNGYNHISTLCDNVLHQINKQFGSHANNDGFGLCQQIQATISGQNRLQKKKKCFLK